MKRINQKGFAHAGLVIILVLSVSVSGLVYLRISSNSKQQSNKGGASPDESKLLEEVGNSKTAQEIVSEAPVTESAAPTSSESNGENTPGVFTNPQRKISPDGSITGFKHSPNDSQTQVDVKFMKGGANFDGTNVTASVELESNQEGTCYFTFRRASNGSIVVQKENSLKNYRTCSIVLPKSFFTEPGAYLIDFGFLNYNVSAAANLPNFPVDIYY